MGPNGLFTTTTKQNSLDNLDHQSKDFNFKKLYISNNKQGSVMRIEPASGRKKFRIQASLNGSDRNGFMFDAFSKMDRFEP